MLKKRAKRMGDNILRKHDRQELFLICKVNLYVEKKTNQLMEKQASKIHRTVTEKEIEMISKYMKRCSEERLYGSRV